MALVKCPECGLQASDQAVSCPHCGFPLSAPTGSIARSERKRGNAPVFATLGMLALGVALLTPRFLLFMPVTGAIGGAVVALFRKERLKVVSWFVILASTGLMLCNSSTDVARDAADIADLQAAEIVDWNWVADPTFADDGTIKWNATVRNVSTKYIDSVEIEFTTFDATGKLVATTSAYVSAIPPGETRSRASFADYYRTETRAEIKVSDVTFAQ